MTKSLLSICCLTYNHVNYISATIEGFLSQKTDFPIEIIIHDDASTDGTEKIVRSYEKKFPDLITAICQDENQYSKGIKPIYKFVYPKVNGKYIAVCEGDDYWTDPYKLQKQVDFMEANPDYGLVHTNYKEFVQESEGKGYFRKNLYELRGVKNELIGQEEIFLSQLNFNAEYHIRTLTVCMKKDILFQALLNNANLIERHKGIFGDFPLFLEMSNLTKFKYFKESMGVYRVLPESAAHTTNIEKRLKFMDASRIIQDFFIAKYGCPEKIYNEIIQKRSENYLSTYSYFGDKEHAKEFYIKLKRKKINHVLLFLAAQNSLFHFVYYNILKRIMALIKRR